MPPETVERDFRPFGLGMLALWFLGGRALEAGASSAAVNADAKSREAFIVELMEFPEYRGAESVTREGSL